MENYIELSPSTMLNPTPVILLSCAEKEQPEKRNLITLAWAGTVNSEPPMISVSIRKDRYSHHMVKDSGEFVINLVDEKMCKAVDLCGVKSGRDIDKAREAGLEYRKASRMEIAPAVEGAPVSISCRVRSIQELGSHDLFLGEVVAVSVRDDLMDEKGTLHLERAGLVAFSHGLYQKLGEVIGFFGWSVSKPDVFSKRMKTYR